MTQQFEFLHTGISGLYRVKPFVAHDERGYFLKDYSSALFAAHGISHELREVFYTSSHTGVVRAVHFQRTRQQAKLVRVVVGSVFDVVVDLRRGSDTFGGWLGFRLSADNTDMLLVPEGCGHGYLVLEPSVVSYKCAEKFYGEYDDGILWNDPDISIDWPLELVGGEDKIILSAKDNRLQTFAEFQRDYGGF